ncbi:MAG TPA: enoyl-CoA hydratase/isomerase family protein [Pyrinomonadaceae bacterium]|nr:enoyl-CoA hydratase/isomerase family protein [Pyrinomonadaceae bacterium]
MNKPEQPVVTELHESVAILRFNRPAERNPLSRQTLDRLEAALGVLNHSTKVIIFTGSNEIFASGANIRELQALDSQSALGFARFGQQLFQRISDLPQISIAAISGYCLGGALDLALACDIRIAAPNAVFAHPGARIGIITGWGGTQRLPEVIGRARALDLLLTARRVSSEEALAMGLVTAVADPVLDHALDLARQMTRT